MAFLEWRRFNFFDLKKNIDNGKLAESLNGVQVTSATGGNGQIILGDCSGRVHIVNRNWNIKSFQAYDNNVMFVEQAQLINLVTVGKDDANAIIKVWKLPIANVGDALPVCLRTIKPTGGAGPKVPTALCVGDQLMAVGYDNGTIDVYRGDITRERTKVKTLVAATAAITGLAIRSSAKFNTLFVGSKSGVLVYSLSGRDRETKLTLDRAECNPGCCALQASEGPTENHFMVGRNDAVYCYTADGRGPCYAVEGEKIKLQWFRSHLVIVSHAPKSSSRVNGSNSQVLHLTVLDITNKFIVFTAQVDSVNCILIEWGGCYIINSSNEIWHLDEKDLQTKLNLLFKKNLYDVAIRIAQSQLHDIDKLSDIYKQYGDHLHSKGDHAAAVEQYIKTIGRLESSYVIRRFLDSRHTDYLTLYLQALHQKGCATSDHTTLLLNCFTRLDKPDQLRDFLNTKNRELDFDVDVAIKVCRGASVNQALDLARHHKKHDLVLKILLEDMNKYDQALDYIEHLEFLDAELYMKNYGDVLIKSVPIPATELLKKLCTDYQPKDSQDGPNLSNDRNQANPEDYIHLFLDNSERLVDFLEYLVKVHCLWSTLVYNTLIEHYLHVWADPNNESRRSQTEKRVLELLQDPDAKYDKNQTLVLCHTHKFYPGVLYLYEEAKMYQLVLRHYLTLKDYPMILVTCKRLGPIQPSLWLQALWGLCQDPKVPADVLPQVLDVIAKEHLQSPMQVLDSLAVANGPTLASAKKYFLQVLQLETEKTEQEIELTNKYRTDSARIKKHIRTLQDGPIEFRGARCSACHHPLELPSIHFYCQHAYHQHCFQSFSENERECPACLPQNKQLIEAVKAQANSRQLHESFHSLLERTEDPFSHVADYFSRGVFNKITIVTEDDRKSVDRKYEMKNKDKLSDRVASSNTYGPGAEAKLRLSEGNRQVLEPSATEGRMRLQENLRRKEAAKYSSSLEANLTIQPGSSPGSRSRNTLYSSTPTANITPLIVSNDAISSTLTPNASNPFNSDNYDESKNPFADDAALQKTDTNPFDCDDDYDKNLNPFES